MKTIDVDDDVFKELERRAKPFEDTTPNSVLRKILGIGQAVARESTDERGHSSDNNDAEVDRVIENGQPKRNQGQDRPGVRMIPRDGRTFATVSIHPAFLTFLFDKYCNGKGNFTTADILPFIEKFHFMTPARRYHNPWMKNPYKNDNSCKSTIEHFRQPRQFGCWGYQDSKQNCMALQCPYHPQTSDDQIQRDRCDLSKGVIWKRNGPKGMFSYGRHYVRAITEQLLGGRPLFIQEVIRLLYPQAIFDQASVERFKRDFHLDGEEMNLFSF